MGDAIREQIDPKFQFTPPFCTATFSQWVTYTIFCTHAKDNFGLVLFLSAILFRKNSIYPLGVKNAKNTCQGDKGQKTIVHKMHTQNMNSIFQSMRIFQNKKRLQENW